MITARQSRGRFLNLQINWVKKWVLCETVKVPAAQAVKAVEGSNQIFLAGLAGKIGHCRAGLGAISDHGLCLHPAGWWWLAGCAAQT